MATLLPDFGKHLAATGTPQNTMLIYLTLRIDVLGVVNEGKYCTTHVQPSEEELYCATFDFDNAILTELMNAATERTRYFIAEKLVDDPFSIRNLVLPDPIHVDIGAILGNLQQGLHDLFIPLVIVEVVSVDRNTVKTIQRKDGSATGVAASIEDVTAIQAYCRHQSIEFWNREERPIAACDICNSPIPRHMGFLYCSDLYCDKCFEPYTDPEETLKHLHEDLGFYGESLLAEARYFQNSSQQCSTEFSRNDSGIGSDECRTTPKHIRCGLNPIGAVLVALWYGLTAAGAMSSGFHFLYEHSQNDYLLAQNLMWTVGIGIGIAIAVCLARTSAVFVGGISSLLISGLLLSLLLLGAGEGDSDVSIFGFRPSPTQFLVAIAALALLSGLLGTIGGKALRDDESLAGPILGIRSGHWFWLWLAVYAWVAILPTGIYYFWLEIISSGYVLIHPSLWLSEAWTEGWTLTFGFAGLAATIYGVQISIVNVSAACSSDVRTRKRILQFLLGTLILAGPVANILFRIAIRSLEHLPDGITANPWWIVNRVSS